MPPTRPRIASLLPSATEIVCLLGRGDDLVGVSHECDHPGGVRGLPILTRSRLSHPPTSGGIDRNLREVLRDALTVYEVLVDELDRARPDVIVTQDLCEVCAVSLSDVKRALAELSRPDTVLVNLHPMRFGDVLEDLCRVGRALGAETQAEAAFDSLSGRVESIRERSSALSSRPTVLTIEWIDPVMIGGTWMPELVEWAGGRPLVTQPGEHAPTLNRAQLSTLDPAPEVVLIKPCGFRISRTLEEQGALRELFADLDWPALHTGRVHIADGNAYFNRPGPRLVDSLEIMAACVHPGEFEDFAEKHAGAYVSLDPRG